MTDVRTVSTPTKRKKIDVSQIQKKSSEKTHKLKSTFLSIIEHLSFFMYIILCLKLVMYFSKSYVNIDFCTQKHHQYETDSYLPQVHIKKS